jgi:hypothetical protein
MKFDRVYHPYDKWEEVEHGMWSEVEDRKLWLAMAIEFTSDHKEYGRYMLRVIREWKFSCENALTDAALNKKAWVGHAACALAIGCPEDVVRQAWGVLTDEQRILANREAERAIKLWSIDYAKSLGLHQDMGEPML